MKDLNVAFHSLDMKWQDAAENIKTVDKLLELVDSTSDIFILPEMWSTGFTMQPSLVAESMLGRTVSKMQEWAVEHDMCICGSVVIKEEFQFFNRFIAASPNEDLQFYDKKYLFKMAGEHEQYTSGRNLQTFEVNGWKIMPQVCYDLRFPEAIRNFDETPDMIIFVASWPAPRVAHWDALLRARAIENQCYVIAVNRMGADGNGLNYLGHSAIYDFNGDTILFDDQGDGPKHATLSKSAMYTFREKLPFLQDKI